MLSLIVGAVCSALMVGLVIVAFVRRNLTEDERFIFLWLLPIVGGIAAGAFFGEMSVVDSGWKRLAVSATGGFAVWLLSYWLLPVPKVTQKTIFVQLLAPPGDVIRGESTLTYLRPNQETDSPKGPDGKITITGFPIDRSALEVTDVANTTFQTKEASEKKSPPWRYSIDDQNHVIISMVRKYVPPGEPTKEEILDLIKKANLSRDAILKPAFDDDTKRQKVILTVKNLSGRNLELWAYDCTACYSEGSSGGAPASVFSDLLRMSSDQTLPREFRHFDFFDNKSGYFALFLRYDSEGAQKGQQFIGIHNLFTPPSRELVIRANAAEGEPFSIHFDK
jgi:hypothetical protein